MAATITTDPLLALLFINNGSVTARWNFTAAVGSPVANPGGIGAAASVTFSFPAALPPGYDAISTPGFTAFDAIQQDAARAVVAYVSGIARVTFMEVSGIGDITFGSYAIGAGGPPAFAYAPSMSYTFSGGNITGASPLPQAGDVWFNTAVAISADSYAPGGEGYHTLLHELGHALGLQHPFDEGQTWALDAAHENQMFTVMSYTVHPFSVWRTVTQTAPGAFSLDYRIIQPQTLMLDDIQALQYLYGANTATQSGDDVYSVDPHTPILMTIWDAGGNDTISIAGFALACTIDLHAGSFSSLRILSDALPPGLGEDPAIYATLVPVGSPVPALYDGTNNLAIAFGVEIENIIGGQGGDTLTGNDLANSITGGAGNDTLDGAGGVDVAVFSGNRADYLVDTLPGGVQVSDQTAARDGSDLLAGFESLRFADQTVSLLVGGLLLDGTADGDALNGGAGNDSINGLGGADILAGNAGDDAVTGGDGNDYLYLGDGDDVGNGDAGIDVFVAGTGNDTANGGAETDYLYMGDGADVLFGDDGVDVLLGEGGNDTGHGGNDGDYFYLGDGDDFAFGDDGNDIFVDSVGNNTAIGGNGQDYFYMGAGSDSLVGGAGVDVMLGDAGNDTFDGGTDVDYLFLGPGGAGDNDMVIVDAALSGPQVVFDFEAGGTNDVIRFTNTSFHSFADVQASISDFTAAGNFMIITVDADTNIWLIGVQPSQLTSADFLFA